MLKACKLRLVLSFINISIHKFLSNYNDRNNPGTAFMKENVRNSLYFNL